MHFYTKRRWMRDAVIITRTVRPRSKFYDSHFRAVFVKKSAGIHEIENDKHTESCVTTTLYNITVYLYIV